MSDSDVLELTDLAFTYPEGQPVLEGVSLSLRKGERVGILGPNGSGKTTLFFLIMGLLRPRGGRIAVLGRSLLKEADFVWARERMGLLFQNSDDQLFCPTVEEDVAFGPRNLGRTREEAETLVSSVLESLGIGHLARRVTYRLSGGEKRLVALATVLAMKPAVLLLDEPVGGIDEDTTEKISRLLPGLDAAQAVISHDRAFLSRTMDRVVTLRRGRIDEA